MCGVSLTKFGSEDFGKMVVISLTAFKIAFIVRFGFGGFPAVWHTIICTWKMSHTSLYTV